MPDLLEMVWEHLSADVRRVRNDVRSLRTLTERSETTGGVVAAVLADAPLLADGAAAGDLLFITNGRKATGEGAGAGTGVMAYYNPSTNTWFNCATDTAVTV